MSTHKREVKLRLEDSDHQLLSQAAQRLGIPLTAYITQAALEKAHSTAQRLKPTPQSPKIAAPDPADYTSLNEFLEARFAAIEARLASPTPLSKTTNSNTITKTELLERLSSTVSPTQKKTLAASVSTMSKAKLISWTGSRDPDGISWEPTDDGRTLWQPVELDELWEPADPT